MDKIKLIPLMNLQNDLMAMVTPTALGLHVAYLPPYRPQFKDLKEKFGDVMITDLKFEDNTIPLDNRKVAEFYIVAFIKDERGLQ